jgi:predicted porin
MKFKTTAIALAVAGSVAAPVVAQAAADELYASARVGVWSQKVDGDNQIEVKSFSSRFGAKGETDLGNGLTGFGRYEWDVDENDFSLRHRYVGLKGDWGSALLGQTYHTFYNFVVGPLDNPWWHSGYTMVNYRGRTDDAVTYAGGTGDFNYGASVYLVRDGQAVAKGGTANDQDDIDAWELGASMAIGDMTLGVAYQGTETTQGSYGTDDDVIGASLSGIGIMETSLGLSVMNQEDDTGVVADWLIGNAYVHLEYLMVDADSATSVSGDDEDKMSITLGYTQSLGRKTTMYYELNHRDNDTGDSDDDVTAGMAVLKYDII